MEGKGSAANAVFQVIKGEVSSGAYSSGFFSQEEIDKGYVLACQTEVHGHMEVEIPPESRLEEEQIMTGEPAEVSKGAQEIAVGKGPHLATSPYKPLVRKIFLELSPPTLEDNITDIERISRELRRKLGWHSYEISLNCLRNLSDVLREHDWKVTATVVKDKNCYRIQRIESLNTTTQNYGVAVDVGDHDGCGPID